jgi:hypothetical protein
VGVGPRRLPNHLALLTTHGFKTFGQEDSQAMSPWLMTLARTTNQRLALVRALLEELRPRRTLTRGLTVVEWWQARPFHGWRQRDALALVQFRYLGKTGILGLTSGEGSHSMTPINSEDYAKGNPAEPGVPLTSKPTWWNS